MADEAELFTIEQLAARTGLTVRNIRSHVTRGLLPAPYLKGRTGYYGPEHVARLQLVTGLQQQGFNLAAIRSLVSGPAAPSAEETVAFYRTALGPWLTESPEVWDEEALAEAFGLQPDEELLRRLRTLGLLERRDDGRIQVHNPALVRVGRQLAALGYGLEELLGVLKVLMQHSGAVAEAFVQMFMDVQWRDYIEAGRPPERLPELSRLIEQLQPLASQAVVAAFQQAITDASARAFERQAAELDGTQGDTTLWRSPPTEEKPA
ncbi:MAG TPA: MerR family transcriptional regulator [Mycobacteriales bacterium]|nr:MerR family transcriptional regulator [Mycobacteriales bacterium]